MRVALDTNVLISALITKGNCRKLLDSLLSGGHTLILSDPILQELSEVASDEKIRKYIDDAEFTAFLTTLLSGGVFVQAKSIEVVFSNPDDEILSTAKNGKASFLVTGDNHILELGEFKGINIVTVKKMLSILRR